VVSYLFSGHTGIYRAQRVGRSKHRYLPEDMKLGEVDAYQRKREAAQADPSCD